MKVFYHSGDLDGKCSGAIIKNFIPEITCIGIDYGQEFPWEDIHQGERVYMVDFSLQPFEDMERLNSIADLVWIDHHQSVIDTAYDRKFKCAGMRVVGKAACELTWEYLHPDEPMPEIVYLLGRYDVRDHKPFCLELQQSLRLYNTNPDNQDLWMKVFNDDEVFFQMLTMTGDLLIRKQNRDSMALMKVCSFERDLFGYKAIAANADMIDSLDFDSVYDARRHEIMIKFSYRKGFWKIGLYTDRSYIDVSEIAKKHGGGGHRQAAGFQTEDISIVTG